MCGTKVMGEMCIVLYFWNLWLENVENGLTVRCFTICVVRIIATLFIGTEDYVCFHEKCEIFAASFVNVSQAVWQNNKC